MQGTGVTVNSLAVTGLTRRERRLRYRTRYLRLVQGCARNSAWVGLFLLSAGVGAAIVAVMQHLQAGTG